MISLLMKIWYNTLCCEVKSLRIHARREGGVKSGEKLKLKVEKRKSSVRS